MLVPMQIKFKIFLYAYDLSRIVPAKNEEKTPESKKHKAKIALSIIS